MATAPQCAALQCSGLFCCLSLCFPEFQSSTEHSGFSSFKKATHISAVPALQFCPPAPSFPAACSACIHIGLPDLACLCCSVSSGSPPLFLAGLLPHTGATHSGWLGWSTEAVNALGTTVSIIPLSTPEHQPWLCLSPSSPCVLTALPAESFLHSFWPS